MAEITKNRETVTLKCMPSRKIMHTVLHTASFNYVINCILGEFQIFTVLE